MVGLDEGTRQRRVSQRPGVQRAGERRTVTFEADISSATYQKKKVGFL